MTQRDVKGSRTPDLGTRSHQPDGCWSGSACGQQRSAESRVAHVLMITADGGRGTHSSSMRRTLRTGAELPTSTYAVQSLERAASLLRSFSAAEPELTIGELARRSHLPRSTVHRLVVNLLRLGFLARNPHSERYRLGLLLAELGTIALGRMGLREKARPIMERLAAETGEVVCLAVLERNRSVYVAVVEGRHGLRLRATVGSVAPLHASATGMVLLASMSEDAVRAI